MRRDEVGVVAPCGMDFAAMRAEGVKRFCDACKKHVHDLSAMTENQARALLSAPSTEGLCVRYVYDADGTVAFFGGKPKLVATGALVRAKRAVAAAVVVALPVSLSACMGAALPGSTMPVLPVSEAPTGSTASPKAMAAPRRVEQSDGGTGEAVSPVMPIAR